jgi:hypothetical protein
METLKCCKLVRENKGSGVGNRIKLTRATGWSSIRIRIRIRAGILSAQPRNVIGGVPKRFQTRVAHDKHDNLGACHGYLNLLQLTRNSRLHLCFHCNAWQMNVFHLIAASSHCIGTASMET